MVRHIWKEQTTKNTKRVAMARDLTRTEINQGEYIPRGINEEVTAAVAEKLRTKTGELRITGVMT